MKKNLLFFLICMQSFLLQAQNINFPDANFKAAILDSVSHSLVDLNRDGEISLSEASACTVLYVAFENISDLTGIENFVNLERLNVGGNLLTTLNLGMPSLTDLSCYLNYNLTSVTVSSQVLASFDANECNLSSISIPFNNLLWNFDCARNNLTSLDVSGFTSLRWLNCYKNHLTSIDVSNNTTLTSLACSDNQITALNLNNNHALISLTCGSNQLSNLNLHPCPQLETISITGYNELASLDLSGLTKLRNIFLDSSNITSVNGTGTGTGVSPGLPVKLTFAYAPPALTSLDAINIPAVTWLECYAGHLTHLTLANFPNIFRVECSANPLMSLDLHSSPLLSELNCHQNGLTSLDLSMNPQLYILRCIRNSFTELDFSMNPLLAYVQCDFNNLDTLDFSMNPAMNALNCGYNPLKYINLKNGIDHSTFNVDSTQSTLRYICADDNDIPGIQDYFDQHSGFNVSINSYCSFSPGGDYRTLNGNLRLDMDNNGCTTADVPASTVRVKIDDGSHQGAAYTNSVGNYQFYLDDGNFTLTPEFYSPYYSSTPTSATIALSSSNTLQTTDFCIAANGVHPDLEVMLIPGDPPRLGFNATYQLVYHNKGTEALSGNVQLNFNDSRLDFVSATIAPGTQSAGSLSWNYSNLLPFERKTIGVNFYVLPPPTNNLNDSLIFNATIDPVAGDETAIDNSFRFRDSCVGSYDPNNKVCLEGRYIDITKIGDYLHYVIRFQNTGNDTAFNVVLKDVLANKYNWNTIEPIAASAPYLFKQTANKIEIFFNNIKLPPTSTNEPGSHGYFAFRVKPASTVAVGTIFINKASIYFDFNLPIVTHNAITTVVTPVILPVTMEYFNGSIAHNKNILHWKSNCNNITTVFEIERSANARDYQKIGSVAASDIRCMQPFDFTDENPPVAVNYYRLKITDPDGKFVYSKVIKLLNSKQGFEIVNLAPNPVINNKAVLNITSADAGTIRIRIVDTKGSIMYKETQSIIAGTSQVEMNLDKLSKAIYMIVVTSDDGYTRTIKFVKE